MGRWHRHSGEHAEAATALLRAIELDPTHPNDHFRLADSLSELDRETSATIIRRDRDLIDRTQAVITMTGGRVDEMTPRQHMSVHLLRLGRMWEALQWRANTVGAPGGVAAVDQMRAKIASDPEAIRQMKRSIRFELRDLEQPSAHETLVASDSIRKAAERFTPDVGSDLRDNVRASETSAAEIRLVDVADEWGLDFEYFNQEPVRVEKYFRIHEVLGGGVAVLDMDRDGRADLWFGQGGGNPPNQTATRSDRIFRNVGHRLVDATEPANMVDTGYATGVAAGDWNQDGWPDLVIGTLNENRIAINQGDGSFRVLHRSEWIDASVASLFTASMAMADIDGDGLPDLIETAYVDREEIYESTFKANGAIPDGLTPLRFRPAPDRIFFQTGDGVTRIAMLRGDREDVNSLGLVVGDLDDSPGNEIFIAADVTPNRLWRLEPRGDGGQPRDATEDLEARLRESGRAEGVALDASGIATAGMGVAAADLDGRGGLDLHVTNFWDQSSSLFVRTSTGFADLAPRWSVTAASHSMLGFGTQAGDLDRDGDNDLVVLNGHIEDFSDADLAFRMRPQVLVNRSQEGRQRFDLQTPTSEGFWDRPTLGRTLAKADLDGDGDLDLVATHLDVPAALLINQTERIGHAVRFVLVDAIGERSAVGSVIRVQTSEGTFHGYRTSGDGYFCSNEAVVDVGIPAGAQLQSVEIRWADGTVSVRDDIGLDEHVLIVRRRGKTDAWRFDSDGRRTGPDRNR